MRVRVAHVVAFAGLSWLLVYLSYLNRNFQLDDALIYQRYIRNLLSGHGLTYNPGERFNGLTSPLFCYLTAAASYALGDIQRATTVLFDVFMLAALASFSAVFGRYEAPRFVLFGALLLVTSRYFYFTSGMETPLFICLIGVCLLLFERNSHFWLGIACALLLLTRGSGLFLILAMAVEHVRQRRPWPRVRDALAPLGLLAGNFLFNRLYYGSFLPSTIAAKIYHGRSGLFGQWPLFANAGYQFDIFFAASSLLLAGSLALALCGVASLRLKSLNVIALLFLTLYTAFFVVLNLPHYHWYSAPYYAFGFFYAGVGAGWLLRQFRAAQDRVFRGLGIATVGALMILLPIVDYRATRLVVSVSAPSKSYREIGLWMKENLPSDAKLATIEIGTLGWYSELYIIDILGLVTPDNAELLGAHRFGEWVERHPPDYILAHHPFWKMEIGIASAVKRGGFVVERDFPFERFRLFRRDRSGEPSSPSPPGPGDDPAERDEGPEEPTASGSAGRPAA